MSGGGQRRLAGSVVSIRMRRLLSVLAPLAMAACTASAAPAPFSLSAAVRVSALGAGNPEQAWAHADPRVSDRLIVCGDERDAADNLFAGYVYASADGGATWRRTMLENSTPWVSEEQCAFGPRGNAYFIAGASNVYDGTPHHETGHMHLYASHDGGATWKRTWTRARGWLDWTSVAAEAGPNGSADRVVVFANAGTDRLGHWSSGVPVAVISADGGRTFTNVISPPQSSSHRNVSSWTGENVVLADGTMLFATSTAWAPPHGPARGWTGGDVAVEVFAVDPATQTVTSRAVLRVRNRVPIFTAAIAQDRSSGPHNGRLYVAWVEESGHASALWLATSDDGGYRWHSRIVLRGAGTEYPADCDSEQPVDQVTLAAAKGTIGIAWVQNRERVRFTTSADGGASFAQPATIAASAVRGEISQEAITWDDYWLDTALAAFTAGRNPQLAWIHTLGLGIVVRPDTIFDLSLAADAGGRFHAFWVAPNGDGTYALMTRTAAGSATSAGTPELAPEARRACAARGFAGARPALPHPVPKIAIAGYREVTATAALEPVHYSYDPLTHVASIDAKITTQNGKPFPSAARVLGIDAHSDIGDARVVNGQRTIDGQPSWDVARGGTLHVVVAISHYRPFTSNYLSGDAFSMAVRVYVNREPIRRL